MSEHQDTDPATGCVLMLLGATVVIVFIALLILLDGAIGGGLPRP